MILSGRVLWLTEDPKLLRGQLEGDDLAPSAGEDPPPLKFGVNTDAMISGAACTLGYSPEVLGPWFLHNFQEVVDEGAVKGGGFEVVVGGDAYGSGSSREVAVVAHQGAGVRLIVARSLQRIFQENLVYCGLPFTTDLGVVDRPIAGDDVDTRAFGEDLPPVFRAVARQGGLLSFGTKLLAGEMSPPYSITAAQRPMTCVERIIAASAWTGQEQPAGMASVAPGDQVLCHTGFRGMHEYTAGMVMALYAEEWGDAPVHQPELAAAFEDHFVLLKSDSVPAEVKARRLEPAMRLTDEMVEVCERNGIRLHGPGRPLPPGVCHRIVVEEYALPGTIICLTDSHTPTAGVLNAFAFGVGSTAMAFALRTGLIPVTVPKTVRVVVTGSAGDVLSPKDLILHLIGDPFFREERWRETPTDTCVIQFGGPGLDQWTVDELSVLTNMTVEGGLMTGIVEPCEPMRTFLRARHGDGACEGLVTADADAEYVRTIEIDLADVPVTVATPGDSRNRAPLSDVGEVAIHNIVIASCTGGSLEDLRAADRVLEGRHLAQDVRVTVTPSSHEVYESAEDEGILDRFRRMGVEVTEPGCGSCIGNGPGIPHDGETTASTTNRNFERRMGAPGPVYLVSPAVAAASAVVGKLTDPRSL